MCAVPLSRLNPIPKHSLVVDYWPSWSDNWERSLLKNTPTSVDVINIAFALPTTTGELRFDDMRPEKTKEIIRQLQKQGKKITIAVGGATAGEWNLTSLEAIRNLAVNIKKMVDDYGLDGVDIDYEKLTDQKERDTGIPILIKELRDRMPREQHYLITYAGWSIGAYGRENSPKHEHPEWGTNKGIEIQALKKAGHLLDWVNVMSYDAFAPGYNYDPKQAIEAYKDLMGSPTKVVLGIELGAHGWPSDVRTSSAQIKPWMQDARSKGYRGVMFWTLSKDKFSETGEPDGTFLKVLNEVMLSGESKGSRDVPAPTATTAIPGTSGTPGMPMEERKTRLETSTPVSALILSTVKDKQATATTTTDKPTTATTAKDKTETPKNAAEFVTVTSESGLRLPNIEALSCDQLRNLQTILASLNAQLTIIKKQHEDIRKNHATILKDAAPHHKEGLTEMFKKESDGLQRALQHMCVEFQHQLDSVIKGMWSVTKPSASM